MGRHQNLQAGIVPHCAEKAEKGGVNVTGLDCNATIVRWWGFHSYRVHFGGFRCIFLLQIQNPERIREAFWASMSDKRAQKRKPLSSVWLKWLENNTDRKS